MSKKKDALKASESLLAELHEATAQELLKRVKSGEASAADLGAAIKFLKDNSIEADLNGNSTTEKLRDVLPTFDDDDLNENASFN